MRSLKFLTGCALLIFRTNRMKLLFRRS